MWLPDASLRVDKNARYWQPGLPHLDSIEFKILGDSLGRQSALASKSVDVIEVNTAPRCWRRKLPAPTGGSR